MQARRRPRVAAASRPRKPAFAEWTWITSARPASRTRVAHERASPGAAPGASRSGVADAGALERRPGERAARTGDVHLEAPGRQSRASV